MNANDIAALARAARAAGITTILQLQIAGELLARGEATLVALAHALGDDLETTAHAAASMETTGGIKVVTCRQALGFTIASLTPGTEETLREFLLARQSPPLRSKHLSRLKRNLLSS